MKKNTNRKHARLQSIDNAQLAQVAGGVPALVEARACYEPGSGWYEFYDAAFTAAGGCNFFGCW